MYVCCWNTHLKHVDFYVLLASLSYGGITTRVWPSDNKHTTRIITGAEPLENRLAVVPLSWTFPCNATLPQLHHSVLLMLQELSAKWQVAVSQRGYCKFLELAPSANPTTAGSYRLKLDSLCGCRHFQCSPSPFTASLPHFLFQAAEGNRAH